MTRLATEFFNAETGAFVERFHSIRVFFYDWSPYSYPLLNPLAKSLLYNDPRFVEGRYLFEVVGRADQADFFVFPCDLNYFEDREDEIFGFLPYYKGNEARHVFFDRRDRGHALPPGTSIHFRTSLARSSAGPSMICVPYLEPVDNFFSYCGKRDDIRYDVSFLGEGTPFREQLLATLQEQLDRVYFQLRQGFFFGPYMTRTSAGSTLSQPASLEREEYIQVIRRSRFVLAPMGYGLNSFRFFEAFSLGVPPILVSTDCALPYEDLIDYDAICLRFEAREPRLATQIADAVNAITPGRYSEMCRLGRLYFDSYLSPRNFLFLLRDALQKGNLAEDETNMNCPDRASKLSEWATP